MKKITIYILGISLLAAACNPMEDIYNELDKKENPYMEKVELTLSDADYESLGGEVAENHFFTYNELPTDYVPTLLKLKYPALDHGSSALVTYNFSMGYPDLSDYSGAAYYSLKDEDYNLANQVLISADSNVATWEVNRLTVKGIGTTTKSGIIAEPVKMEVLYTYDSGWSKTKEAYYVTVPDYNAMGAPGKYDNFSGSERPEDYLPSLLALRYPYALEGDQIVVVYKYYSNGTRTRADEYHLLEGSWTEYNPVVVYTDQFILTRNDGWVFDPTIIFTMNSADYQLIVDWVKTNKGSEYIDSYGTQEFYFSAGSYYSNYNIRDKWDTGVFSTWQDAVKESISKVLLPGKFPDAIAQVSGIDVMYEVTFATYDGNAGEYTWIFQCTKSAPDPEFIFVDEK